MSSRTKWLPNEKLTSFGYACDRGRFLGPKGTSAPSVISRCDTLPRPTRLRALLGGEFLAGIRRQVRAEVDPTG
jgi:hypothetical protein